MVLLALLVATTLLQVLSRYVRASRSTRPRDGALPLRVGGHARRGHGRQDRAHFFVDLLLERLPPRLGKYVTVLTASSRAPSCS